MRRLNTWISIALSVVLVLMLVACSSDAVSEVGMANDNSGWHSVEAKIRIASTSFDANGASTRAADDDWKDGDCVYLLLEDKNGDKTQAFVEYDGATKSWGKVQYKGDESYLTCDTPRKVDAYYFDGTQSVTDDQVTFTEQTAVYVCSDGEYTFPSGRTLTINLTLNPVTSRIRFAGTENTTVSVSGIKSYMGFSRSTGELSESTADVTVEVGNDGFSPYVYGVFADSVNHAFVLTMDGEKYLREFDSSSSVLKIGRTGKMNLPTAVGLQGWEKIEVSEPTMPVGNAVDLGLSVKWADMNVGATTPEDYGDYFAWGETEPKSTYDWNMFDSNFSKYATNEKTTLDPEDDAAHVNWGGDWRMPTKAEQNELRTNCTWTWTTQNGVSGYKVSSKTNGNSLFLPAAGYRWASNLNNAGSDGQYWSSSLSENDSDAAYCLYFNSSGVVWSSCLNSRNSGLTVRAVCP